MSNTKISALSSASTPLSGSEIVPINQSGITDSVSVANLTAGRTVSMAALGVGTSATSQRLVNIASTTGVAPLVAVGPAGYLLIDNVGSGYNYYQANTAHVFSTGAGGGNVLELFASGGASIGAAPSDPGANNLYLAGNLVQGTAGKGINFTANTPASGMTSQNLTWYEEGTWTPAQGSGLTVVGAFSSTGKYTRIGREVRISATVTGATSIAVSAAGIITNNLPFTVGTAGHGNATNAAVNAFAAVICTTTNVTSAGVIGSTGTITFSATYFV